MGHQTLSYIIGTFSQAKYDRFGPEGVCLWIVNRCCIGSYVRTKILRPKCAFRKKSDIRSSRAPEICERHVRPVGLSVSEEPALVGRRYGAGAESHVLKTAPSEELRAAIRGHQSDAQGNPA
jgi:hypothetical protein